MRTVAAVVLGLWACGASSKPPPAPPAKPVAPPPVAVMPPAAPPPATGVEVCKKLAVLQDQHCSRFDDLDTGPSCAAGFDEVAKDPKSAAALGIMGGCVMQLDTCADVVACLAGLSAPRKSRACDDKGIDTLGAPVGEPRPQWMQRLTRKARRYSEIHSTKAEPIEVCGIATENDWLTALACDDGSQPFHDASPETMRAGSLGEGGRCKSIIDLYRVKCPEATYDIYLDGYVCPIEP
jgi:hypothetical protein